MNLIYGLLILLTLSFLQQKIEQKAWPREGVFLDMLHFVVTPQLVQLWLVVLIAPLGALLLSGVVPWMSLNLQLMPVHLLFLLPICDLMSYGMHRLQHTWPVLWRFHRVHHSSTSLDVLSSSRFHSLDAALQQSAFASPLFVFAYLDGTFTAAEGESVLLAGSILIVWNVYTHGRFFSGPEWLDSLLVTPRFHRLHHHPGERGHYALQFAFWDRLFQTSAKRDICDNSDSFGLQHKPDWAMIDTFLWPR